MPPRSRWNRSAPRVTTTDIRHAHQIQQISRGRFSWDNLGRTPAWGVPGLPQRCNALWDEKQHRCPRFVRGNDLAWKARVPSWGQDARMPAVAGTLCRLPYRHYEEFRTSHRHWMCGEVLPDPQGYE